VNGSAWFRSIASPSARAIDIDEHDLSEPAEKKRKGEGCADGERVEE
jgi:hypothetical protein